MAFIRKSKEVTSHGQKNYSRRPINAYYRSKEPAAAASPFKKRAQARHGRKVLFGAADIILLAAVLSGLVYSLILNPQPKLKISDSSYRTAAAYQQGIDPLFSSLKNRNKLSFDETKITAQIQAKYPEVQSVQVELPFFSQKPVVWLNISKPAFNLKNGETELIVDSAGLAVAKAQDLPKLRNLVSLNDQSGYSAALGKQVIDSQAVQFINSVIKQVKRANVPLSSLALPAAAQEMDLRTSDASYYVKFYLGGDALTQTGQFLAARQKFSKSGPPPAEYLDVRVNGKIFYK